MAAATVYTDLSPYFSMHMYIYIYIDRGVLNTDIQQATLQLFNLQENIKVSQSPSI